MSWRPHGNGSDEDAWRRMGGPGGDWQGLRPSFDNPMTWSVTLGRVSGITVRIHVLFLLFVAVEMLRAVFTSDTPAGPGITAVWMASLFVIVLTHEFGHCIACRWVGGAADEILMWPLGGLAYCRPGQRWRAHLVTAAGGPAVNVVICITAGVMLGLASGQWLGIALPNPLALDGGFLLHSSWGLKTLYLVNWTSLVLLLFNLLPIFPLDGGRIFQAILWRKQGYVPSMRIAVRVGYLGAIGLGLFGAVKGEWMLVGIALFGGITCYLTHRQMQYTESVMSPDGDWIPDLAESEDDPDEAAGPSRRQRRREERRLQREANESRQVDEILEKIARTGMESLSGGEKKLLRQVSERKRNEGR